MADSFSEPDVGLLKIAESIPLARVGHKKKRRGCAQCKRRHVRCNEEKPCSYCVRRGVACSLAGGFYFQREDIENRQASATSSSSVVSRTTSQERSFSRTAAARSPSTQPNEYRGRPTFAQPALHRRDSSASSVRSMIDDRMQMANEERGRSRYQSTAEPASPFRSGSSFEPEYAASRRSSMTFQYSDPVALGLELYYSQAPQALPDPRHPDYQRCGRHGKHRCATFFGKDPTYAASFTGITDFIHHVRRSHQSREFHYCPYCDEIFSTHSTLSLHVLGDHQCAYCENEEPYSDREDLSRHLKGEHLCRGCWLFMTKDALALHPCGEREVEVHVSIEPYAENNAGDLGKVVDEQGRSKTRTPSFSPPYMRPSARRSSFTSRQRHEHGPRNLSSHESDTISTNASLAMPVLSSEESQTSQTSLSSTAQFSSSASSQAADTDSVDLTRRVSLPLDLSTQQSKKRPASPATERKHACGICGKSFTRRTLRDNHLRTHTDERPFLCSQESCSETFKQKNEQIRHEQTKHQEKRYACGGVLASGKRWGCGKRFARSDGLLEHQTKTQKGQRCLQQRDEG